MLELLWVQRGLIQALLVILLFAGSAARGAAPERWCASVLLLAVVLIRLEGLLTSNFRTTWGLSGFVTRDIAYLAIDLLTFLGLAIVGIRANRTYPLWMAGFLLTALLTHIASRTTDIVSPLAFAILNLSTFWLAIATLAAGLAAHIRRERRWGTYPSWRGASPHSPAQTPTRWHSG